MVYAPPNGYLLVYTPDIYNPRCMVLVHAGDGMVYIDRDTVGDVICDAWYAESSGVGPLCIVQVYTCGCNE